MNLRGLFAFGLIVLFWVTVAVGAGNDSGSVAYDSVSAYGSSGDRVKSLLFDRFPNFTYPTQIDSTLQIVVQKKDTLVLPDKIIKLSSQDSLSQAFKKYWTWYEKEEGFDKLRDQIRAWDINRSKIPHWYFFDSSLVLFPNFFVIKF